MRKFLTYILLSLICQISFGQDSKAQNVSAGTSCIPVHSLSQNALAFQSGEKLQFVMHYKWGLINSDVGTAEVSLNETIFNGTPAFLCMVNGRTTPWYDRFFKVREDFRSWFTKDGLKPLKFTRNTLEGKYRATNTYIYAPQDTVIYADVFSTSSGQRNIELPYTSCTYDLPSLFFLARNIDMSVIKLEVKYPMTFAIDDDVYNVYFIYHGKTKIKHKEFGEISTLKFSARLLAGEVFKSDTDMTIYISDDENRLPVYFVAPILVGTATGRMVSYSGIKYPFISNQTK